MKLHFRKSRFAATAQAVALLVFAACSDGAPTSASDGVARPARADIVLGPSPTVGVVSRPVTLDEEFARIARDEIPGFAGFYSAANGAVVMRMTGFANATAALDRANAILNAQNPGASTRRVTNIAQADFDYIQLKAAYDIVMSQFGDVNLTMSDIDEVANRIRVSLKPGANLGTGRARLVALGIPSKMLIVEHRAAMEAIPYLCAEGDPACAPTDSTNSESLVGETSAGTGLQAFRRPLVGGLEILFTRPGVGTIGCTIWAIATFYTVPGFLTASHCAIQPGNSADGTVYTQGGTGNVVSNGRTDPGYPFSCNGGLIRCRYSDAAFVRSNGASMSYAKIAEPIQKTGFGDVLAVANYEGYTVEYARRVPLRLLYVGEVVMKVGANTGYSDGRVEQTCVAAYGVDLGHFCQTLVRGRANHGDSGAPVFSQGQSFGRVTLEGLLSGGDKNDTSVYIFSPWSWIEYELTNTYGQLLAW